MSKTGKSASAVARELLTAPSTVLMIKKKRDTRKLNSGHAREKPRCWEHECNGRQFSTPHSLLLHRRRKSGQIAKVSCVEHGCNGRQFSTWGNLLRHQRRKSGQVAKVFCWEHDATAGGFQH